MNKITIRKANINDLKTLLEFEQGVIETERPLDPFLKKGKLHYYTIPEMITARHTHLIVVIAENELVGSGYIRIEKSKQYHKNQTHGYIGFMYVKPAYRGRKISYLILEELKKWAKQNHLKEIRLDVYSNNFNAIKAYDRFGFRKSLLNMRMDI